MSTRSYQPGDSYKTTFTVKSSTGALANADSLPAGAIYKNGVLDGSATVTVTNLTTGVYLASHTISGGYAAGDAVDLLITATVGGVATGEVVDRIRLQTIGDMGATYTTARAAKLDNLDVATSTRSTYAGADTAGTSTLLTRLTSTRAGLLDNLDAAVSSRSTFAGTGVTLASNGLDAVVIEAGLNARQSLAILSSACAGVLSGLVDNTPVFKGAGVSTVRITATVTDDGRPTVTLYPPA